MKPLSDRIRPDSEAAPWVIQAIKELEQQLAVKDAEMRVTVGVGDGTGSLYVHGSYDAVKTVQTKLLKLESVRRQLAAKEAELERVRKQAYIHYTCEEDLSGRLDRVISALTSLAAVARRYLPDYDEHPEIQKADDVLDALASPAAEYTPLINIKLETRTGDAIGSTSLPVIRVEHEDDGSFTAVSDYWPQPRSRSLSRRKINEI